MINFIKESMIPMLHYLTNSTPPFILAWDIHPEDRHLVKGVSQFEIFSTGKVRGIVFTVFDEKIITHIDSYVNAVLRHGDKDLIKRLIDMTFTCEDACNIVQWVLWGEIRINCNCDDIPDYGLIDGRSYKSSLP